MVGWGIDALLSGRFYKVWKKEGFIKAWERGRSARFRPILDNCGTKDHIVPLVGVDIHGNRYYEEADIDDDASNQAYKSRWVEFADRTDRFPSGRKIPPEWHGWLHKCYDDAPTPENTAFHNPPYKKRHLSNPSGEAGAIVPYGHGTHPYKGQFTQYVRSQIYQSWTPETAREKKYD